MDIRDQWKGKPNANSTDELEKFVSQCEQSINEQELIDNIKQILESSSIYVFGELLDVPKVKQLDNSPYKPYLNLLNIFAYGTYQDYVKQKKESPESLPDLSESMKSKLCQLSIVSLAKWRRHIPYTVLMEELGFNNIRQLEALIIEAIYNDIIKGKMDQQNNLLEINQTIARDVREEDFVTINNVLNEWCRTCDNILSNIEHQIETANSCKVESIAAKQTLDAKIATIRKTLKPVDIDDNMMGDGNRQMFINDNMIIGPGEKTKRSNRNYMEFKEKKFLK